MKRSEAIRHLVRRLTSHTLPRLAYPLGLNRMLSAVKAARYPNAVFIWIPKAAGTSIWTALNRHHCPKLKDPYAVRHCFSGKGIITFCHQSYLSLKDEGLIDSNFDASAFKFTFVRNPFDRTVSMFTYLQKTGVLHDRMSFKTFCFMLNDRAFAPIGSYNDQQLSICNPQVEWIKNSDGSSLVDFVGRMENVAADFHIVCDKLGITCDLPHSNRSVHGRYVEYYDDVSRSIIEDVYAEDLQHFDYRFEAAYTPSDLNSHTGHDN